ncbi:MAG: cytochrome c3 family protein [Steroidobacteraceae bacterium]
MRALRPYAKALLLVLFAVSPWPAARAASIEKLIMPGPVTKAHAKLEGECSNCHDRANRERQTALCLDCHKEIAADLATKSRYHGRMREAASGQCRGCHTEHLGRDADINKLNEAGFTHELTNFPLQDAHVALTCGSCHRPAVPYRKTSSACLDCHRKDDVHRGALGTDCTSCHDARGWQQTRFDHDKTDFALTGRHADVHCAACHAGEKYRGTPKQCSACHMPDDVHKGSQGAQCADCHTTADWVSQKFDHQRETGFALLGRHAHIGCADCHRSGNLKEHIPKDCAGCHQSDDRHASRLGPGCAECHGNSLWRVSDFDHLARFKFALEGVHADLDCHACHTGVAREQKLGTDCLDCHRADEPHGGTLGKKCEQCHAPSKWQEVSFDHDMSAFPLVGLHTVVTCGQCHTTQRFKEAAKECSGCHAREDVHNGGLGKDCGECHTPNGWKMWDFDHAAHTRFPLLGAHAKAGCAACHLRPQNLVKPSMICASCHAGDDVHAGRFGPQCQQCHTTTSFKRPRTS